MIELVEIPSQGRSSFSDVNLPRQNWTVGERVDQTFPFVALRNSESFIERDLIPNASIREKNARLFMGMCRISLIFVGVVGRHEDKKRWLVVLLRVSLQCASQVSLKIPSSTSTASTQRSHSC